MNFQDKLKLINAVCLVADFWEVEPSALISFTALTDLKKKDKWNKIAREVQEYSKMGFEDRAKKLGFTITK